MVELITDQARALVLKSNSPETRRTYETRIREFFLFHSLKHPVNVEAIDVVRWRDSLIRRGSRPATVTTKLSVVRSFFNYLREAGVVDRNPASTKLVPPPELPEGLSGRTLLRKKSGISRRSRPPKRDGREGLRPYSVNVPDIFKSV